MDLRDQLRDYLAQNQQIERQKDRFGDLYSAVTSIRPSEKQIAELQQMILKFSENPNENIEILLKNSENLQYIPLDFVNQLSQSKFYTNISILISNPEYAHLALIIVSKAISPISNFTNSILQNIKCDSQSLYQKYSSYRYLMIPKYNKVLSFLGIIELLMSELPSNADHLITAIEECVGKILAIKTDSMQSILPNWGITLAATKRVERDLNNPDLCHQGVKLLNQIVENPYINSFSAITFAQKMIITEGLSEDILCDSLLLLSKIVSAHLKRLTGCLANQNLINRLISLLTSGTNKVKINTVNLILQLSRGTQEPINMLISKGLYPLLLKFAQECPDNSDQVLIVAYSICTYSPSYVESICNSGFIQLLTYSVENGPIYIQRAAIYLASNIMYKGTFKEIRQIITPQIFSKMIEFLEEECIGIKCILTGMINGLHSEAEALDDSLKKALSTQEFFSLLQQFTESDDKEIVESATILMQHLTSSSS